MLLDFQASTMHTCNRYLYIVVGWPFIYGLGVTLSRISPAPVDLSFTGDTPLVIGNDIFVNISVSPARPLRCELVTRGEPGNPIISRVEDCKACIESKRSPSN